MTEREKKILIKEKKVEAREKRIVPNEIEVLEIKKIIDTKVKELIKKEKELMDIDKLIKKKKADYRLGIRHTVTSFNGLVILIVTGSEDKMDRYIIEDYLSDNNIIDYVYVKNSSVVNYNTDEISTMYIVDIVLDDSDSAYGDEFEDEYGLFNLPNN
jgi:hypothetical protein